MERSAGDIIRFWRKKRQLSQMALADRLDVSFRHMNFLENNKAKGSPELLQRLGEELGLTFRARNALLMASGHAPSYRELDLSTEEAAQARRVLEFALTAAEPYPANIIDSSLNIVMRNRAMDFIIEHFAGDPAELLSEPLTMQRLNFHPSGLLTSLLNPGEVFDMQLGRVHRYLEVVNYDPGAMAVIEELKRLKLQIPERAGDSADTESPHLLIPFRIRSGPHHLDLVTAVATLGWSRDVTLEELRIEYGFPADDASNNFLQAAQAAAWTLPG
jgi:transcriptional regulator with XRE-family HTH domain